MRRPSSLLVFLFLGVGLAACRSPVPEAPPAESPPAPVAQEAPTDDGRPLVVFLGDSLTAGYGLAADQAFPAVLAERLAAEGRPIRIVNAGVSGDTSAGGANRLEWLLRQEPDVVVVGLGGNDGLRGLGLDELEANLRRIVEASRAAGAKVLLLGMKITPNLGPEYSEGFEALYARVAAELEVAFVPFFLEGVAGDPELNQPDGIHPTAEGQRRVAENVLPALEELLPAPRDENVQEVDTAGS